MLAEERELLLAIDILESRIKKLKIRVKATEAQAKRWRRNYVIGMREARKILLRCAQAHIYPY